ncbi:hypothetical protein [Niabella aquatica]
MQDTPEHIKKLQLEIWLQKSPGERLYQALKSNEELFLAWKKTKEQVSKKEPIRKL